MIDRGKRNLLGVGISAVDYEYAVAKIMDAAKKGRRCATTALAVHGVITGAMDSAHRYRLNTFDLVTPDGQPVRWGLNLLHGTKLHDRVYGPTMTLKVCQQAALQGIPVYFYGSSQAVLDQLCARLPELCPGLEIAGAHPPSSGFFQRRSRSWLRSESANRERRSFLSALGVPGRKCLPTR